MKRSVLQAKEFFRKVLLHVGKIVCQEIILYLQILVHFRIHEGYFFTF